MMGWLRLLCSNAVMLLVGLILTGCGIQQIEPVVRRPGSTPAAARPMVLPTLPIPPPAPPRATPTAVSPLSLEPPSRPANTGYRAYVQAVIMKGRSYTYACEFDAAWVVLQSYGFAVTIDELIGQLQQDTSRNPGFVEQNGHTYIYGGDILRMYSGDYKHDYLARTTGTAFAQVFGAYGLQALPVHSAEELRDALDRGSLVWLRATVDFHKGVPAIWITPDGTEIPTVLGNDHTVVVIGYDEQVVVIRDPLGPTSTNRRRPFEYEVEWPRFLAVWEQQNFDALAVERPITLQGNQR